MKQVIIKLYKFNELSEEAKETAINQWRDDTELNNGFHWLDEIYESYKGFEKSLPYGPENEEITGIRLRTWIINNYLPLIESYKTMYATKINGQYLKNCIGNNSIKRTSKIQKEISCPFTGYCADHDAIQPLLDFIKNPNVYDTWESLIDNCKETRTNTMDKEIQWQLCEEYIIESIEANEYDFTENGEIY